MKPNKLEDMRIIKKPSYRIYVEPERKEVHSFEQIIIDNPKKKTRRNTPSYNFFIYFVVIAIVLFGLFKFINLFHKADVMIEAKQELFDLKDKKITASKAFESLVPFDITIISDEDYLDMNLTYSENVSIKAKGEVVFYNENSASPQILAKNTYISDKTGKTYLTDKAITIPGYKTDKGKMIPGQVQVGITAFLAGDVYNGSPELFNVSSFKDTPKYNKIYAKIKSPLIGGALGLVYKVTDSDLAKIDDQVISSFKNSLFKKIEIPSEYILYDNAYTFSYEIDKNTIYKTADAKVKISGTLTAILLKEKEFSIYLLNNLLPKVSKEEKTRIKDPDISLLSLTFANKDQVINKETETIDLLFNGKINFIWEPDVITLTNNLVNVPKNSIASVFAKDPGVGIANTKIFPPWKANLPNNRAKINITVK